MKRTASFQCMEWVRGLVNRKIKFRLYGSKLYPLRCLFQMSLTNIKTSLIGLNFSLNN